MAQRYCHDCKKPCENVRCPECARFHCEKVKIYYKTHRQEQNEYKRKWYHKHKEECKARATEWQRNNKEKKAEYNYRYRNGPYIDEEKLAEWMERWREAHKEG